MTRVGCCRPTVAFLAGLLLASPFVTNVRAQAWVPARGEGAVSVSFQNMHVKNHLATTTEVAAGDIDTNAVLADVTFGLTSKIAVDFSVPFVASKYSGPRPHPGTDIDNGQYHSSFTDLRFALRYNITRSGLVVTPYAGSVTPSHDYPFYGHAAPGVRLRELQMGVYAAKLLERGLPGLFVSGRYAYGFVEKVQDISHNRSLADLEVGYFFTPGFRAFGMASGGYTHGGIDFPAAGLPAVPDQYKLVHDQIQRVHYLDLGVGAAYSVTDAFDVFGSFSRLVAGRNGHALDHGVTVGVSWGFRRGGRGADAVAATAPSSEADSLTEKHEGTLLRCICQKGS